MRRIAIALTFLLLVGACSPIEDFFDTSQRIVGSGVAATEVRSVESFDTIRFLPVGDLTITTGIEQSITLTGDDNLLPRIKTIVTGSTLTVSAGNRMTLVPREGLTFEITVPDLHRLEVTGVSDVEVAPLVGESFSLDLTGVADVNLNGVDLEELAVAMTGAGSVRIEGIVDTQRVTLSGVGSYEAADLRSRDTRVLATGTGSATVWATDVVDIVASGVGSVRYWGNPSDTNISSTGIGGIESLGDR